MAKKYTDTSARDFLRDVTDRLGRLGIRRVRPKIDSTTLKEALVLVRESDEVVRIHIPHYWAVWYHDGRGAVRPKKVSLLVWFQNPSDDPRLAGGYPVRPEDVKRLTRAQWLQGLRENRKRQATGQQPFMVVTRYSGPTKGHPFFEEGMEQFEKEAQELLAVLFDRFVRQHVRSETLAANVRLR